MPKSFNRNCLLAPNIVKKAVAEDPPNEPWITKLAQQFEVKEKWWEKADVGCCKIAPCLQRLTGGNYGNRFQRRSLSSCLFVFFPEAAASGFLKAPKKAKGKAKSKGRKGKKAE